MKNTKILAITGANSSGKTTLAFKIAKELEKNDKEVCIISFDTLSPLATIKDNYENYNVSLGYLLTKDTSLSQREIYSSMIPITDKISIISYIYGDMKDKYPKLVQGKVRDFIDLINSDMVDYIIIDAGANILKVENRVVLQMANKILKVVEPTYKSIAYNKTFNIMLNTIDIDTNKITTILNKIDYNEDYKIYANKMGIKYYKELVYVDEIQKNVNSPMRKLQERTHENKKYVKQFKVLMKDLYGIDFEYEELESNIEIKEHIKPVVESRTANEISKKIESMKENKKVDNEKKKSGGLFGLFSKAEKNNNTKKPMKNLYIDEGSEF